MDAEISIIVPIYNMEDYLEKCIKSILAQTYTNFELLLIDDGSTDNCGQISDKYAEIDKRIRVYHELNRGVCEARNIGLSKVKGNYICFIDPDDYVREDYLEQLYVTITQNNTKVAVCNFINFNDGEEEPDNKICEAQSDSYVIVNGIEQYIESRDSEKYACLWNKIYHKSVWHGLSFPAGKMFDDAYVYYKILDKESRIAFTDSVLYFRRWNDSSITHQKYSAKYWDKIDCRMGQVQYFHDKGKQRLVEISYRKLMYYFWECLKDMHEANENDADIVREYQKRLRKIVKFLKVTKTYSLKELLSQYYVAYYKKIA